MGKLYVVATPIGNLGDMTARAINVLTEVDFILAEDTRHTRPLLTHFGIQNHLISFHAHSSQEKAIQIVGRLVAGEDAALVTDAGTPLISDPGSILVQEAIAAGIEIVSVPGPSAVIAALSIAGIDASKFIFEGFLPKTKEKKAALASILENTYTTVIYESPHQLLNTLTLLSELAPTRMLAICKELTKRFEHVYRMTAKEAVAAADAWEIKGEYVLVIAAKQETKKMAEEEEILRVLEILQKNNLSKKDAASITAEILGRKKNEVYQIAIKET